MKLRYWCVVFCLGLSLGIPLLRSAAQAASDKLTVCTVTINSDDEKKTFQQYLNPKDFEFRELTDFAKDDSDKEDWFNEACESGIQCDVLVVSGHFGGTFFGSSGLSLSTNTLEEQSCRKTCSGILSNPREVFLFGCNTLASKDKDHRTPEEYLRVLLEDNIPRQTAERVVEARYGAMGDSFRDRMSRVFAGVPHLYGFSSVGPSGQNVKGFLQNYFKKKKDYAQHLQQQAIGSLTTKLNQLNRKQVLRPNLDLGEVLRVTSFAQCSGLLPSDPSYETKQFICSLHDENASVEDRLKTIHTLMQRKDFLAFLPTIETFFENHPPANYGDQEKQWFTRITSDKKARDKVLELIKSLKRSPVLLVELVGLAANLQWMTPEESRELSTQAVAQLFSGPFGYEEHDAVCSLVDRHKNISLRREDLPDPVFKNRQAIYALSCIKPEDPDIHASLAEALKDLSTSLSARIALERIQPQDHKTLQILSGILKDDKKGVRIETAYLLGGIKPQNPATHIALAEALKDPSNDVRYQAVVALRKIKPQDPKIHQALAETLNDIHVGVTNQAARALNDIQPKDPSIYQTLTAIVIDSTSRGRLEATWVLVQIKPKDPKIHQTLAEALNHPHNDVREAAIRVLAAIKPQDPKVHETLLNILKNGDINGRECAAQVLGEFELDDPKIHQALTEALKDGNDQVRDAAVDALKKIAEANPQKH